MFAKGLQINIKKTLRFNSFGMAFQIIESTLFKIIFYILLKLLFKIFREFAQRVKERAAHSILREFHTLTFTKLFRFF